ncbi:hypothetical protein Tco_0397485 [Tanacetum coccineum]
MDGYGKDEVKPPQHQLNHQCFTEQTLKTPTMKDSLHTTGPYTGYLVMHKACGIFKLSKPPLLYIKKWGFPCRTPVTSAELVAFQVSNSSTYIKKRASQGKNPGATIGRRRKQTSSITKHNPGSKLEATKTSTSIHYEFASGHDASTASTTEVDPRKYNPNDSISKQQGASYVEKEINFDEDEFNTSPDLSSSDDTKKDIKLEDLSKLIPNVEVDFMDLNSPEDDEPIIVHDEMKKKIMMKRFMLNNIQNLKVLVMILSKNQGLKMMVIMLMFISLDSRFEASLAKLANDVVKSNLTRLKFKVMKVKQLVKGTVKVPSRECDNDLDPRLKEVQSDEDKALSGKGHFTSIPDPQSPKTIKIQELSTQLLLLQTLNHKPVKEKKEAEIEAALLKAKPYFLNVEHLTELLKYVEKLEIELPRDLKEIPTKLEKFSSTVSSLTTQVSELKTLQWELPAEFLTIPSQVSSIQAKIKTLDALPSLLTKVTEALDRFVQVIEAASHKAGD